MLKGEIGSKEVALQSDLLVIDAELLFTIKRRWYWWRLRYETYVDFSRYNETLMRWVRKHAGEFDEIRVGMAGYERWRREKIEEVMQQYMGFTTTVLFFDAEESYKNWLHMAGIKKHLALAVRRYYTARSVWLTLPELEKEL